MKKCTSVFEEVRLVYHNRTKAIDRPDVRNSEEAYEILLKNWDMGQIDLLEECKLLLLDNNMKLMSIASISKGGFSSTIVDPGLAVVHPRSYRSFF